jgi:hypothetical protein
VDNNEGRLNTDEEYEKQIEDLFVKADTAMIKTKDFTLAVSTIIV